MDTWNVWVMDRGNWQLYASAVSSMAGVALGADTGRRFELVWAGFDN